MDTITTAAPTTPLRQRMQDDMMMPGFGTHTRKDYICHVRSFAAFLGRPPNTATSEDLRRFQLDQHERAVGRATIIGAVSALRFLFTVTLKRPEISLGLLVTHYTAKSSLIDSDSNKPFSWVGNLEQERVRWRRPIISCPFTTSTRVFDQRETCWWESIDNEQEFATGVS